MNYQSSSITYEKERGRAQSRREGRRSRSGREWFHIGNPPVPARRSPVFPRTGACRTPPLMEARCSCSLVGVCRGTRLVREITHGGVEGFRLVFAVFALSFVSLSLIAAKLLEWE